MHCCHSLTLPEPFCFAIVASYFHLASVNDTFLKNLMMYWNFFSNSNKSVFFNSNSGTLRLGIANWRRSWFGMSSLMLFQWASKSNYGLATSQNNNRVTKSCRISETVIVYEAFDKASIHSLSSPSKPRHLHASWYVGCTLTLIVLMES